MDLIINNIYFSATGTTKKICQEVVNGIEYGLNGAGAEAGAGHRFDKIKVNHIDLVEFSRSLQSEFNEHKINAEESGVNNNKEFLKDIIKYDGYISLNIFGAPIYEGYTAAPAIKAVKTLINKAFTQIKSDLKSQMISALIPFTAISVYGNRTIGRGLKDLVDLVYNEFSNNTNDNNFIPLLVGSGSFIGEHSYSYKDERLQIAMGRPDADDLKIASEFGSELATRVLTRLSSILENKNEIGRIKQINATNISNFPGKLKWWFKLFPKGFSKFFARPSAIDTMKCTKCQLCVKSCPTNAIYSETLEINYKKCISCMACVKVCTQNARNIKYRMLKAIEMFMSSAINRRKESKYRIFDNIIKN